MTDQVDSLDALDEAIEKAQRLISPRARRDGARMERKFSGGKLTKPSSALNRRITRRKPGHFLRNGAMLKPVNKSLEALDEVIEKALRVGGIKVSPAQRRRLAMESGGSRRPRTFNLERTKRTGYNEYRGSKQKPFTNPGARGPSGSATVGPNTRSAVTRRIMARAKQEPSKRNKNTLKVVRENNAYAIHNRRGDASPYKRTLFGGLKRVKKTADDVNKAKAKTLYVYRPVENAADIIAWAESQGFKSTQPAEKLHVTLAFSKTPLNWAMLHDDYHLEPSDYAQSCGCEVVSRSDDNSKRRKISGGVREVKALGKDGAVVLAFESDSLTQRWMDFKRAGAAWSFPSFTPHITISYDGGAVDLSKGHPYAGDIILGEECWEEVDEKGQEAAIAAEKGVKKSLRDLVAAEVKTALDAQPKPAAKEAA